MFALPLRLSTPSSSLLLLSQSRSCLFFPTFLPPVLFARAPFVFTFDPCHLSPELDFDLGPLPALSHLRCFARVCPASHWLPLGHWKLTHLHSWRPALRVAWLLCLPSQLSRRCRAAIGVWHTPWDAAGRCFLTTFGEGFVTGGVCPPRARPPPVLVGPLLPFLLVSPPPARTCVAPTLVLLLVHSSGSAFGGRIFFRLHPSSHIQSILQRPAAACLLLLACPSTVFTYLTMSPCFFPSLAPVQMQDLCTIHCIDFCFNDQHTHCHSPSLSEKLLQPGCVCGTRTQVLIAPMLPLFNDSAQ